MIPAFVRILLLATPIVWQVNGEIQLSQLQPAESESETLFKKHLPAQTGVNFINRIDDEHPLKRLYISGFACGGVSLGDLDQDGNLDVVLTTGSGKNKIFRQTGRWQFEEVAWDDSSDEIWSTGAALFDLDNDGDLDIYVCNYDRANRLYLNETEQGGEIKFREAAAEWGLDLVDASLTPSFADYDLDGDLDLFLLTSEFKRDKGRPIELPIEGRGTGNPKLKPGFEKYYTLVKHGPGKYVYYNAGRENILLQNQSANGVNKFVDVSKKAGIRERTFGLSCVWYDHDADGDPDLYVCNDFDNPDQLYLNNGDGTFTDVLKLAVPYTSWFAMGSDAADLNGDGRFDLVIADMGMTTHYKQKTTMGDMNIHKAFLDHAIPRQTMRNTCMINTGTGRFMEAGNMAGLSSTDWTWAVKCSDFDCDGLVDVFFANGMARKTNDSDRIMPLSFMFGNTEFDFWKSSDTREEKNLAFRNRGDLKFENVSEAWGISELSMSYSAATGDIDNDGDLDLIVANLDVPVSFFENTSPPEVNRASLKLRGTKSNRMGVGAVVRLTAGGLTQVKALNPMTGFISCNESALQFGLGSATKIDRLEVAWPGGGIDRYENLEAGFCYTLTEKTDPIEKRQRARPTPSFIRVRMFPGKGHLDRPFDDYLEQPLLPWKQSQMGPGMAWADLDNDGDHDFFLSQGAGTAGAIFKQQDNKSFQEISSLPLTADADSEDMAPLFFDADKDGQMDLLVTSGSVEHKAGDKRYSDRLYLGLKGGSGFAPAYLLPGEAISSSAAAVADIDHDGDLDLFIGGRVVPGKWPTSPGSRLYINESSPGNPRFTLAGDAQALGLKDCKRATSALWTDIDGDGWSDLIVTTEYGPVMVFQNRSGTLEDITGSLGFSQRTGIWNGIAGRDIDGDGDIDYVVSNFGLNTTYKASDEKPEVLYYGDLEGTGEFQVVEAKFEGGIQLPRRGMSCSSNAMPTIKKNLGSYQNFAVASLSEIYTPKRLEESGHLELTTLSSTLLINQSQPGKPQFELVALPRMAQLAPAFGVMLTDLDGDRATEVILAQNFYSPQREVGRMSGSAGAAVLRWTGEPDQPLAVIEPFQTGIIINGDSKGLTINELNGDSAPDLVFTENSGPVSTFLNTSKKPFLHVVLIGKPGNTTAVGARVTVTSSDGVIQAAEVSAGGSYLSQSAPGLFFGVSQNKLESEVQVTWPDGSTNTEKNVRPGKLKLFW